MLGNLIIGGFEPKMSILKNKKVSASWATKLLAKSEL